jgi:HlyD family secretion protein
VGSVSKRLVIAIAVISVIGAWVASGRESGIDVTAGSISRVTTLQSLVTASGEIVATRYANIGSPVLGRLVSLSVKEGDTVRAGQTLGRIDAVQAAANVAAVDAALDALRAEAEAARKQVDAAKSARDEAAVRSTEADAALVRSEQLRDAGLLPAADFDRARSTAMAARAQLAAAASAEERAQQAALATGRRVTQGTAERTRARDQLDKTEITAPIDGVVTRLNVEVGEMVVMGVQNQPGTILMTLSDLSSIDAEVKVAEADVMRLAVGMPAAITLEALSGRRFKGRVVEIGASALPVAGTAAAAREFRVTVRLEAADQPLRPGLTCDAEIVAAERPGALVAPLQSVVQRGGQTGVFVIDGERARFVPVRAGLIGGLNIEVEGLADGTSIITGPVQVLRELADGARVRVATR